ncbi:IS256 family transposase [Legionella sp. PATHC038]|uniref:IS256 family transposase n=4 Tax=Legionella sheltonii TaxID=2992041 RepID=UPI00224392D6|nr:IS256 family transposase [Legionella sp. PATHC038]MCW8397261.1 IS256 family transposase [Legionella sp. PATHC038]MCW8397746.1 IS256 family transposase [Legionella sp. PATHC038]MCW8397966.1 IS256 family transposase [Legionella sp. PATHC038]MCW8398063.1 IS256 family transposase [Legionella sp. PATHC038]MCW8399376.1 IS256 family transposase [Legionella sp. PATHC038]
MNKKKIDLSNFDFNEFKLEALTQLKSGQSLTGKDGILTPLIKELLEAALEGEMDSHMTDCHETGISNRRNGKTTKTIKSTTGVFDLETPRDRDGSFEPELVKKRQTVLNESLDNKVLALYAIGMSYEAISEHLSEMYGLEVSSAKISLITDKLLPLITEWRNRSLESVYPIVFLDAMHFKVRVEGKVISRAFYTVLAVNSEGKKDILGLYLSEAEGARFWLSVLNDLKARGVEDILIASIDGLKGFPDAIAEVFPNTEIQLCVVHQIRNSLKYVVSKDQKAFMADLKLVYKASSKDMALHHLLELEEKWGKKYPAVMKSWNNNWEALSQYFKYPEELRRIIYTTNIVEGFHRQIRKYTKNKGAFTSENALIKLIYCACQKVLEKWNQPMHNWALIVSQLQIYFEDRLTLGLR